MGRSESTALICDGLLSEKGFLGSKAESFVMSEQPLPSLPSSPCSVNNLDLQFTLLDMSTENSSDVAEAQPAVSSNAVVPLLHGPRQELLGHFKEFLNDLPSSKTPGFFNVHFECLDEAITVRHYILFFISRSDRVISIRLGVSLTNVIWLA